MGEDHPVWEMEEPWDSHTRGWVFTAVPIVR